MRAARRAGRRPATAPMRMAATMPPAQASVGTTVSHPLTCRVHSGGQRPQADASGAADESEEDGFGEELDPDVTFGGAQGAAQPDLGSSFEDGDDHDVGHPDRADEQGDGAEAEEEVVEGALGVGLGHQRGGGLGHVDFAGVLRVGGRGQEVLDRR